MDRIIVKRGNSFARDEEQAVTELAAAINQPTLTVVIFL